MTDLSAGGLRSSTTLGSAPRAEDLGARYLGADPGN
jgi:hypothetical protein